MMSDNAEATADEHHALFRFEDFNWKTGALLAPALLLLGASPASAHQHRKAFQSRTAQSVVTIHNPNGKVIVKAWTKSEVMVIANHASDKVEVDAEQTGNRD